MQRTTAKAEVETQALQECQCDYSEVNGGRGAYVTRSEVHGWDGDLSINKTEASFTAKNYKKESLISGFFSGA